MQAIGRNGFRTVGTLVVLGCAAMSAGLLHAAPRAYYTPWTHHAQRGYFYRHFYFKPEANQPAYRHHYAIHFPQQPLYVYFYDPQEGVYWGRYDFKYQGFSLLEPEARKPLVSQIPAEAFPLPGELPPLPGAQDGFKVPRVIEDELPGRAAPPEETAEESTPGK